MPNEKGGLYTFALWLIRLSYLNLMWILFILFGLGIFGFMPSTAAMFVVVRKWIRGNDDGDIFTTFSRSFRTYFFKANGFGVLFGIVGYLLVMQFRILGIGDALIYVFASYSVIPLFLLYMIVGVYFFPIFVHFDLERIEYFKWSLIIGVVHPLLTLLLIVGAGVFYYFVYSTYPVLLLFLGGSVTAYFFTWGASQTFWKYSS